MAQYVAHILPLRTSRSAEHRPGFWRKLRDPLNARRQTWNDPPALLERSIDFAAIAAVADARLILGSPGRSIRQG